MSRELERHALSKFWDDISGSQFSELVEDIKTYGLHHPITLYDGHVLDGWQRYRACLELGIAPKTKTFKGTPSGAAALVKSLNAHRRLMMTESQRALAIVEMSNWVEGCKKGGGVSRDTPPLAKTNAEMAKESGASRTTVQRAKRVAEQGSEKLKDAVRSGDVPLKKAAAVVDLPKSEQLAAATAEPKPGLGEFVTDEEIAKSEADQKQYIESLERAAGDSAGEIKRLNQLLTAAYQARDRYMRESSAMRKQIERLERENKRLKKQLDGDEKKKTSNGARAHA